MTGAVRTYEEECRFLHRETSFRYRIDKDFVPGMNVPGVFYVNKQLEGLMFDELEQHTSSGGFGGFLPAVKQVGGVVLLSPETVIRSGVIPVLIHDCLLGRHRSRT